MQRKLPDTRGVPFNFNRIVLTIKLCVVLTLFFTFTASATVYSQNGMVTIQVKSENLGSVLNQIKDHAGVQILFNAGAVKHVECKDINLNSVPVSDALSKILEGSGLTFSEIDGVYVIKSNTIQQQSQKNTRQLQGRVFDDKGDAIPSATVRIKGATIGVAANAEGRFTIDCPQGEKVVVVVSFVGMKTQEVVVPANHNGDLKIVLKENVEELDEAVVTGIFNKPKESFTGAAVKITGEELRLNGNRDVLKAISNIDPSFMIIDNNVEGSNPNALPSIQLRGTSTIPVMSDYQAGVRADISTPLFILDGFEISLERMLDLNNDEISSVTILKDASSTALYGSRGTNGVIVITSVKPKSGRFKINYNGGLNMEIPNLDSYNFLNAEDKLELENQGHLYESEYADIDLLLKEQYAKYKERVDAGVNTNWLKIPTRLGVGHNHYLGLTGGHEEFRYSVGLSYNNILGAMKTSTRETFNGNINVSYNAKKIQFSNQLSFGINGQQNSKYGSFSEYAKMNQYWEPYDSEGQPIKKIVDRSDAIFGKNVYNPVWDALQGGFNKARYTSINDNFSLNYQPIDGLRASISMSFNKTFRTTDVFKSPTETAFADYTNYQDFGLRTHSTIESYGWQTQFSVSYGKAFGKHSVYAGFNTTLRANSSDYSFVQTKGFINASMNGLQNGSSYSGTLPTSNDQTSHHVGFVGTFNYSYDNRYYVDASYRSDGASSFGSDKRFAPFYSLGAGWTISNENFIKDNLYKISNLRVKWSYGVTGSMNFSPWQSQGTYSYQTGNWGNYRGVLAAYVTGLENKDLKWQDTYQHNLGFELGLFENKLSFSYNYYHKLTKNSITTMSIPISSGFESYTGNKGEILNTGMDFNFTVRLLQIPEKKIFWSASFVQAYNKNKLKSLSKTVTDMMNSQAANQTASTGLYYIYREGSSVDAIWAIKTAGVDPSTGRVVYVYKDGTQSYNYDATQLVDCGDQMPKLDARVSTNFNWNGLSVNMNFSLKAGGYKYNYTFANKVENTDLKYNVDERVGLNRWKQPGDEAPFIAVGTSNPYVTDRYVQKERIFQCNNLNISYDFRQGWVKNKLHLDRLGINASISNLFYISTIKQERGTGYPYAIQPTFGLSCAF